MKQATRHRRQFVKQTFWGPGLHHTTSRYHWSMGQWWKVHKFKSALEWYRAKLTTTGWITQTYHQRCWSCLNQEGTGKTWQDSDLVESVEFVKGAGRSLSCSRVQEGQAILVDMERERERDAAIALFLLNFDERSTSQTMLQACWGSQIVKTASHLPWVLNMPISSGQILNLRHNLPDLQHGDVVNVLLWL